MSIVNNTKNLENQKEIIELLTEIKELLEEIRDDNREENDNEEPYTCDGCGEENTDNHEPYKIINKYTFCSWKCYNTWEKDTDN